MHDRHWSALATFAYAAGLAWVASGLVVADPYGAAPLAADVAVGIAAAGALVYGGGYERLGVARPGKFALLELFVTAIAVLAGIVIAGMVPVLASYGLVTLVVSFLAGQWIARLLRSRIESAAAGSAPSSPE